MSFTTYRSAAVKTLWSKYTILDVRRHTAFSNWRIDDICADHWKAGKTIFDCVKELENYLVNDLHVEKK